MDVNQNKQLLHNAAFTDDALRRVCDEIYAEFYRDRIPDLALIGIQTGGVPFARRIAADIRERNGLSIPVGMLDISMYRDDIGMRRSLPMIRETEIPFDVNRKILILADDVLQSGRSIRAALDALTDFGRPNLIRLAALFDREQREFPIRADYAGAAIHVDPSLRVQIEWTEYGGDDAVYTMPGYKAE